jgi:hypothetical protein
MVDSSGTPENGRAHTRPFLAFRSLNRGRRGFADGRPALLPCSRSSPCLPERAEAEQTGETRSGPCKGSTPLRSVPRLIKEGSGRVPTDRDCPGTDLDYESAGLRPVRSGASQAPLRYARASIPVARRRRADRASHRPTATNGQSAGH